MDWPLANGNIRLGTYVDVSPSGTPNVKGSWYEIYSSLAQSISGLCITMIPGDSLGRTRYLIDIGIGASSSEVVVVPNIPFGTYTATASPSELSTSITIPIHIAKGQRVSARCQSLGSGSAFTLSVAPITNVLSNRAGLEVFEDFGCDLSNTWGTAIASGTDAAPTGPKVELIAATTRTYRWMAVFFGGHQSAADCQLSPRIRIGFVDGSEPLIFSGYLDVLVANTGLRDGIIAPLFHGPVHVPKGARILGQLNFGGSGDPNGTTSYMCGIGGG